MLTAFEAGLPSPRSLQDTRDPVGLVKAIWIDLLQPTAEEIAAVQLATGIVLPNEADLAEIES